MDVGLIKKGNKEDKKGGITPLLLIRSKYLQEKELDPAFDTYDKQSLDNKLCKFYAEARTVDGDKKSTLRTTRHGLNRYLGNIFDADLTKDAEFKESEKVFFAVCTDLKRQGFGGVDHHPLVDD